MCVDYHHQPEPVFFNPQVEVEATAPVTSPKPASNRTAHIEAISNGLKLLDTAGRVENPQVEPNEWQSQFLAGEKGDDTDRIQTGIALLQAGGGATPGFSGFSRFASGSGADAGGEMRDKNEVAPRN